MKNYVKPLTDIVVVNLLDSVLGTGDAAGSGHGASGDDGLVNTIDFEEDYNTPDFYQPTQKSLWD